MRIKQNILLALAALLSATLNVQAGERYNFNAEWLISLGNTEHGEAVQTDDSRWEHVTLPHAWNESEAYSRVCGDLSDTIMWYRKHFRLPKNAKGKKIFIEFEGVRFGAHVFINGHELGWSENGVMAFGFDLTPHISYSNDNILAVYVDSDWRYKEQKATPNAKGELTHSGFQWNDRNFYCNYGGINKNVWLHVMDPVFQTLPLYSNLGTTGVYVAPLDISIEEHNTRATILCETQVVNSSATTRHIQHRVIMTDKDGHEVADIEGEKRTVAPGDTITMSTSFKQDGLHLWSWGYGYLYTVRSVICEVNPSAAKPAKPKVLDVATIQTGFRKTEFRNGMFRLNNRVMQLKGFAQRSTNEWPALGISIPAWMSDYSNSMILGCNGNFVRWMHVTPSKQDIRSFDRLGLIEAMPAGDAEKDVTDRRWQQRCEVMRDAIIYNRNNPSIIFYEGGNNNISDEHMAELKAIRDKYDPHGGRAIGSRNMLDSKVAEYGGEMLYVNKSANEPVWQMEYNRDEGIRRYWDQWSFPFHKEGEGPAYRGDRSASYNHNQDGLAIENIVRWNEYWEARPGSGTRVNSGGAKIIFSDSNTHARGEKNYRTSGDVDPMRIPKDSWFCHKVMWNGWVDTEQESTYIIGHWNYDETPGVVKPVYVCSTADEVELWLNNRNLGKGKRSNTFLFTFDNVRFEPGVLCAIAYRNGQEVSRDTKETVGTPAALRMRWIGNSTESVALCEIEAVDAQGRRHPLAHDMLHFDVTGNATYVGGVSGMVSDAERALNASNSKDAPEGGHSHDTNGVGSHDLMLEAGVIRILLRTDGKGGSFTLHATPTGGSLLPKASLEGKFEKHATKNGFYVDKKGNPTEADFAGAQPLYLDRGETPATPSYTDRFRTVEIAGFEAASNTSDLHYLNDDIEDGVTNIVHSVWKSDGLLENAWLKVNLTRAAKISRIAIRMDGFRTTSYPLQIWATQENGERTLVWEGYTYKCLGDCHLNIEHPVEAKTYEIRMIGPATVKEAFASMTELAAKQKLSTEPSKSTTLAISEISLNETAY